MRITYKAMTTKYTKNLSSLSTGLNNLNNQVASGRKYSRTSEDVSSAIKGYQIRRSLSKVSTYQDNISHAQDFLTNSESTLSGIEDSLTEATGKTLQGMNASQSSGERKIIATELRTIQDQLLQTLNTTSSDSYIFGGSNTETKPFTVVGGKLLYNGNDVDSLTDGSDALKALKNDTMYVDIGLGVAFKPDGTVDSNSVFNYSFAGISIVGNGTTTIDGVTGPVSNNFYNLLGQIADEFESTDYSDTTADSLYGHLKEVAQKSYQTTTEIGAKENYLDFMTSRYETQDYNLQARQTEVEGVDATAVYIDYKTQSAAYQAALQMGNSVIQQSVFDYMS